MNMSAVKTDRRRTLTLPKRELPEVKEIKRAIAQAGLMEAFCREYLPAGRKHGRYWICGASDGSAGDSFYMNLSDPDAGFGFDFALNAPDDIIDCMRKNRGMTLNEALSTARHKLGMPIEQFADYAEPVKSEADIKREAEKRKRNVARARQIWEECNDVIGSLAEKYLRDRAIARALPVSLRFHKALGYWDAGDDGKSVFVGNWPALVCMIQRADGSFCGIHRIYLDAETGGKAKIPTKNGKYRQVKKVMGDPDGGAIRCCDDDEIVSEVGITEGVEDALSVPELYEGMPAWAAVSAGGIRKLVLPDWITHPVLLPDNDKPRRNKKGEFVLNENGQPAKPGPDACAKAHARMQAEGRHSRISPIRGGKDVNAVLMHEKWGVIE